MTSAAGMWRNSLRKRDFDLAGCVTDGALGRAQLTGVPGTKLLSQIAFLQSPAVAQAVAEDCYILAVLFSFLFSHHTFFRRRSLGRFSTRRGIYVLKYFSLYFVYRFDRTSKDTKHRQWTIGTFYVAAASEAGRYR